MNAPSDHTAYARAALDLECAKLAGTQHGRNHQVNLSGFACGQFIPSGLLDRHEVETRLWSAAEASGIVQKDGPAAVRATLRSGIESGMRQPRVIPEASRTNGAARPKPQPAAQRTPESPSGNLPLRSQSF